jgi:putative membrane protein
LRLREEKDARMKVSRIAAALIAAALIGTAGSSALADASHRVNQQDREFLKSSAEGAKFEVLGGRIAQHHADSNRVERFGALMVKDHSREFNQVLNVAHEVGVNVPHEPSPEQQQVLENFKQFHGSKFDCFYISYEWVDHEADIAEAELELAEGENPKVLHLAHYWLGVYKEHDELASDILLSLDDC